MRILFTICGRAGSKGIKNKNIRNFLGYPLPFYTYSAIDLYMKQEPEIEADIAVNTDSKELINLFLQLSDDKISIIEREPDLGKDETPKIKVIENCLTVMEKRKNCVYDMVVDLDVTAPLRTVADINKLIQEKTKKMHDVVFSVTDSRRNPYFNMVKKVDIYYERVIQSDFNTRQEAPEIFDMNASMYAYSREFLMSGKNIFDGKCGIIRMYDTGILDLDHEKDYELMEVIAQYLFKNKDDFNDISNNVVRFSNIATDN